MKYLPLFILVFFSSHLAYSQEPSGAFEYEDHISEFIYGVNLNTNGGFIGGLMIKYSKIRKAKTYDTYGLEIVGIKNPKEVRLQNQITGNSFIFAKRNYFFSFRPQYGRDFILFRKSSDKGEGVQVSAVFAAGPSLGLQVPYHILYNYNLDATKPDLGILSEQYDPEVHNNPILIEGTGGLFEGLGGTNLLFGINAKAGISLDFGAFRNSVTGVEAGFTFEAFDRAPEIMAFAPNEQVFTAAYLTIFFGTRK